MGEPIVLNHRLWEGGGAVEFSLPDRWNVQVLRMKGDAKRPLEEADYDAAISRLAPLVAGHKEVCVLFDESRGLQRHTGSSLPCSASSKHAASRTSRSASYAPWAPTGPSTTPPSAKSWG